MQNREEVIIIVVGMVGSGLKESGKILVLIQWLVPRILSDLVTVAFTLTVDLGHRMPSLRALELSQIHLIPFVIFVGRAIVEYVMRKEISTLSVFSLVKYNGIFLQG